ncbi:MAG: hypothetical protein HPM95_08685 [Alphaproteobacteria bacterium]|nr:hypothetical protein [Alphaproteobacteria bacterium]
MIGVAEKHASAALDLGNQRPDSALAPSGLRCASAGFRFPPLLQASSTTEQAGGDVANDRGDLRAASPSSALRDPPGGG